MRAEALKGIQRYPLCIQHTLKGKAHREVTNLHLDHPLLSGFTASHVYVLSQWRKKFCLLTWLCMSACLIFFFLRLCLCVSMHACVRGQEWRCYPLVIHHKRDTLSPALRYAEAMFYKRITRQRAPTGHPLPPCATCKRCTIDSQISRTHCAPHMSSAYTIALIVLPVFFIWRAL